MELISRSASSLYANNQRSQSNFQWVRLIYSNNVSPIAAHQCLSGRWELDRQFYLVNSCIRARKTHQPHVFMKLWTEELNSNDNNNRTTIIIRFGIVQSLYQLITTTNKQTHYLSNDITTIEEIKKLLLYLVQSVLSTIVYHCHSTKNV